jgi:hypothetical protein
MHMGCIGGQGGEVMFADLPNTSTGITTSLTTFATAMAALSVASERVTDTIKQWFNPKPGGALSWFGSDWFTQILAFGSGVLVIWLSQQDPFSLIGNAPAASGGIKVLHLILGGLLVSGGSATWNHILDILKATKVQKETAVNKILPAAQQITP